MRIAAFGLKKLKSLTSKSEQKQQVQHATHDETDIDKQQSITLETKHTSIYSLLSSAIPNPIVVWNKHLRLALRKREIHQQRSLYIFEPSNSFRRLLLLIVENSLFDRFILLCILVNCVFLAIDDDPPSGSYKANLLWTSELIFNIIYSIEMIIKLISWGLLFSGPYSYLRSPWNILDAVVVCGGWINTAFAQKGSSSISALRSLRLLKPLKAISSVPGMKVQVKALLSSIPSLLNVLALMTFLLFVFGILGMQLMGGKLRYRCVINDSNPKIIANNTDTQVYGLCSKQEGLGQQCQTGSTCIDMLENPNNGATSFDNILGAWLTILTMISLEGWSDVMYMIDETTGHIYDIYFVLLILFGSLFLINLIIAVIFIRFKAFKELEEAKMNHHIASQQFSKKRRFSRLLGLQDNHQQAQEEEKEEPDNDNNIIIKQDNNSINSKTIESNADSSFSVAITFLFSPISRLKYFYQKTLRPATLSIISYKQFDYTIVAFIVLNALILSLEKYPMSDTLEDVLNISNYIFTFIFTIEMILKLIGLGIVGYLSDQWNIFDGIIVIVSLIDIFMPSSNSSFTALRTFRLLRVFKLLKFLHGLRELLETVLSTLTDLKYFSLILTLFVFIYALIGVQFFRGKFTFDGETSRAHFDTFLWSSLTVFQILTGENWNEVLYDGVKGAGWWSSIYFISCFLFGNYIILSLFMAILLGNFEVIPADEEDEAESRKTRNKIKQLVIKIATFAAYPMTIVADKIKDYFNLRQNQVAAECAKSQNNNDDNDDNADIDDNDDEDEIVKRSDTVCRSALFLPDEFQADDQECTQIPKDKFSLGCIHSNCFIRKYCIKIVANKWFERFIMFLILISSILLCLDEPRLNPNSNLAIFLYYADIVITILFTIEMVIKIIALGLIGHDNAYLRSGWNRMDGFIVIISIMNLFMSGLKFIKGVRALRALRPLRMVSRFESMKLVVNSIFATIPALGNVVLITLLFFYIFAIIGTQQFAGLYWYCVDTTSTSLNIIYVDKLECIGPNQRWQSNILGNFDNVFSSMLILFELATLEQWPSIMYSAIDARGPGLSPERDAHPERAIFFVVFLLVCSFFVLSLFVGVVVDEYHKYHDKFTNGCITDKQKEWLESVRHMINVNTNQKMEIPQNKFRAFLFRIVTSDEFELLITILIGLNIVVMSLSYYDAPKHYIDTLDILNLIFTYIFIAEVLLKWTALGIKQYFKDKWNLFDFFIVFCSVIVLILDGIAGEKLLFDPTIARVLRVIRVFRVIKRAESLKQLLTTLVFSLPALWNVGILLFLLFFIYAVAGMSLFGNVMHGEFLNNHANFETFGFSLSILYRMSTGESWNGIYHDCSITENNSNCIESDGNCGSPFLATLYFLSFYLFSAMVMLNVFVAVVLKNFEEQIEATSRDLKIEPHVLEDFEKLWISFCEKDGETMKVSRLGTFLNLLSEPLGLLKHPKFGKDLEMFILKLDIPQTNGLIHYIDLGTTLTLRVYGIQVSFIPEENEFMRYLRGQMFRKFPKFKTFQRLTTPTLNIELYQSKQELQDDEKHDQNDKNEINEQEIYVSTAADYRANNVLSNKQRCNLLPPDPELQNVLASDDLTFGD